LKKNFEGILPVSSDLLPNSHSTLPNSHWRKIESKNKIVLAINKSKFFIMETTQTILIGLKRSISPTDVILLTADINYTQVYFSNGLTATVAVTLKELEKRFADCSDFFRTHKSYLINLNYVKQYDATGSEVFVQMKNDYRVIVSRRKKEAFRKKIMAISK
jgi:DNA-binding LytR/AlgR family response regulator